MHGQKWLDMINTMAHMHIYIHTKSRFLIVLR